MENLKRCFPKRRLPLLYNLFHRDENGRYRVNCRTCAWEKIYDVINGTAWNEFGIVIKDDLVKTRKELPAKCPLCGEKTKNKRLPWPITWKF